VDLIDGEAGEDIHQEVVGGGQPQRSCSGAPGPVTSPRRRPLLFSFSARLLFSSNGAGKETDRAARRRAEAERAARRRRRERPAQSCLFASVEQGGEVRELGYTAGRHCSRPC
jgi:hypothetical protein